MSIWRLLLHIVSTSCTLALLLGPSDAAARCLADEIQIGEDEKYYYCLKMSVVSDCRQQDGDVDKCIRARCVRNAGEMLKNGIAGCKGVNEMCLAERGAPLSLITAISACLLAAAADNLHACFAASVAGAAGYDWAVALCRAKFGDCVEPELRRHSAFIGYCRTFRAQ